MNIVLCSSSPRRQELLARLGREFAIIPSRLEEDLPGFSPGDLVQQLALDKASVIAPRVPNGIVIGADTIIDLDGEAIGKPHNPEDARGILGRLSNRDHLVLTGVAVLNTVSGESLSSTVATRVRMKNYPASVIEDYVNSGEPMDKAGAYAIQEGGAELVESIEGCYFNVVGFPLCEVAAMLSYFEIHPIASEPVCIAPGGLPCPRLDERARVR